MYRVSFICCSHYVLLFCIPVFTVLAQNGHFKDEKLVNYLAYLQYWKDPQYAKYLKYVKR